MGPNTGRNGKEWTCCFGLHVRSATIIIGVWHLVSSTAEPGKESRKTLNIFHICVCVLQCLNLLALGMLTIIIRNPAMVNQLENTGLPNEHDDMAPALPTPLSKIDPPYAPYRDHDVNYRKEANILPV